MSNYQGGRGGWGRAGGTHRGGQYDNQGRGSGANPNWRGPPLQHSGSGSLNPGAQYLPRGPWGGYRGSSSTPRGSSLQQVHSLQDSGARYKYTDLNPRPPQQPVWAPRVRAPLAQCPASTQQQQAQGSNLHQAGWPRQPAAMPQATSMAVGGVSTQELADEELEELMAELALQPETPPPGGAKAIKFLPRTGKGTRGQKVLVRANHFLVQLSCKELHHYDVC